MFRFSANASETNDISKKTNEMHKSEFSVVTIGRAVAQLGRASEPA
jgi:hypothetical protein